MKMPAKFPTNYVLVDFENVQPKNLALLQDTHFKIFMFVGAQQNKLDMGIVSVMQNLGPRRAKYVRVEDTGKNALDFCLTFYLGALVAKHPTGYFHIISKDKGFDPLVAHLNTRGLKAARRNCISEIPIVDAEKSPVEITETMTDVQRALSDLKRRGESKPRSKAALINTLKSIFRNDLNDQQAAKLFQKLMQTKHITVKDEKLAYHL